MQPIKKNYLAIIDQWIDVRAGLSVISGLFLMLALLLSGGCGIAVEEPDVGSPSVLDEFPARGSKDVRVDAEIRVTFSEEIAADSINSASFIISGDQNVPGSINVAGNIVTFIPSDSLSPEKTYTVIIKNTVTDLVGNQMKEFYEWTFSTGAKLDRLPPVVHRTVPASGATGVPLNTAISVTFTEKLDKTSFAEVQLRKGVSTESIDGPVVYVGQTLVFDPSLSLEPNTKYILEIEGTGLNNQPVGDNVLNSMSWSFTTGTELDTSPPRPATKQMPSLNIVANDSVYMVFNEALDVATLNNNNFYLETNRKKISGEVKYFDKQIIFTPTSPLSEGTYDIVAETSISDLSGNLLSEQYRQSVLVVTSQNDAEFDVSDFVLIPTHNSNIVPASSAISVTFKNETLRPDSVHAQAITVTDNDSLQPVLGEVSLINGQGMKFIPVSPLKNNQAYSVNVSGVMDLAGNSLANPITWSFNTVNIPDTTAPVIVDREPAIDAQEISTNRSVSIAFNEALDPAGIDQEALALKTIDNIPVSGTVAHENKTLIFTPSVPLSPLTVYVVTAKAASIRDLSGNILTDDIAWQFTTASEADVTPPTVLIDNSYPPDQSTNLDVIELAITVQFSEAMNTSSVVQAGALHVSIVDGAVLPGAVTVDGSKAIFTPTTRFDYNQSYQVVVNEKVADRAGNILGNPVSWVFSTKNDDVVPTVKARLPLPDTSNVKVSDLIINANFSEAMAADTITDQSFLLTKADELVAASISYEGTTAFLEPATSLNYATQYQVTLTTDILDVAGNALTEKVQWQFTTEAQTDIEAPAVQSTSPAVDESNVAIGISSIDIQLSEAIDSASVTTERFIVKVVDGDVIQGQISVDDNTVSFQPSSNLVFNTRYQVELGADITDLVGNVLGEAYVFTFTTSVVQDVTSPSVDSVLPINGATDIVANGAEINATFSEEIASASLTLDSFTVRTQGGEKIAGEVKYANRKAHFLPSQPLAFDSNYTAELSTQVTDLVGNPLSELVVWSFSTEANPDKERPNLKSLVPFFSAKDVEVSSNITVIFSEAMDPNGIHSESFIVTSGSAERVTGFISYQDNTVIFDPTSDLPAGSRVTVILTPDITDEAGNELANSPFTWSFNTKANSDITPTIQGLPLPANEQQNVTVTGPIIRVEFSEEMDENTINVQTFTLASPQGAVDGSVTYNNQSATFTVAGPLAYDTTYTATVTRGVKDLAQNALAQDFVWSFHTKQAPPTVTEVIPVLGATDVPLTATIDVTFSKDMEPSTINTESFLLTEGGNRVAGTITYGSKTAKFKSDTELLPKTTYTVLLTGTITDMLGKALEKMEWGFTTKALDPNAVKEITVSHTGSVNAGKASFQRYAIKNLAAGQHIVSLSQLDNDVDLHMYNQDFTESLCSSELPGRLADFCVASTSNQKLYLEVQNTNDNAESTFTINAQPLANIATVLPKDGEKVEAGGIKFYQVSNELSQDVVIRQWDRAGDANLYVYSDLNADTLCSTKNANLNPNYCAISATELSNLFVVIDGSEVGGNGAAYSLSLEHWQVISVNSSSGSVGADANFYRLDNLTAGVNYKVELSNMVGLSGNIAIELNADINAIKGKSCSSGNNATPPSCQAVANGAGELYLVVDGFQSFGTDFDLTITPVE